MDINQLSKKIENKLLKDTSIKNVKIIDNTYKHLKHNSHQKGKYHIKLEINSEILKKTNRIQSNKVIYKILSEELKTVIHSPKFLIKIKFILSDLFFLSLFIKLRIDVIFLLLKRSLYLFLISIFLI